MSRIVLRFIPVFLAVLTGCGGSDGPSGPADRVFTSLSLTSSQERIFSRSPGNTAMLTVRAMDQAGQPMTGLGAPTFTSEDPGVASVDPSGMVTAVARGTTAIRASLSAGGVTHTATVAMAVIDGEAEATVTAPGLVFMPQTVDLVQGGTVTWTFTAIPHNVVFRTAGAPADYTDQWSNGSRSRTFPERGTFRFDCTIHAGMSGEIVVR